MTSIVAARPTHPALNFTYGLPTPPLSPISPTQDFPAFPSKPAATQSPLKATAGAAQPPATPATPAARSTKSTKSTNGNIDIGKISPILPPNPSYDLLRSHHISALKYTIAKLRWEQANSGYNPRESAWQEHNGVIAVLEKELLQVQAAQARCDAFPTLLHSVILEPTSKPYGPPSREQWEKAKAEEKRKAKELDKKLDEQFPFIKQLFIGPMTKQQARDNILLRQALVEGDMEAVEMLLPSENMRWAMELQGGGAGAGGGEKKAAAGPAKKKKPYAEARMDRERENIKKMLEEEEKKGKLEWLKDAQGKAVKKNGESADVGHDGKKAEGETKDAKGGKDAKSAQKMIEKEGDRDAAPFYGPKTREQALLPIQREQRHLVLNFLRKPWPVYDEEAAGYLERMARLAVRRLSGQMKDGKEKAAKERDAKDEEERADAVKPNQGKDADGEEKPGEQEATQKETLAEPVEAKRA